MTFSAFYSVGTVTLAAGGTVVTGVNTSWAGNVAPGDIFWGPSGLSVRIASVDSATKLTLAKAWPGAALNASAYEVWNVLDAVGYQRATRDLLMSLSNGALPALSLLVPEADTLPYFTGLGTATALKVTDLGNMKAATYDPQGIQKDAFTRANHKGTQEIATVTGLASALGGAKNLLLNGSFLVNQLAVSGTVTLAAGAYGHDGWKAGSSGCSYTFAQSGGLTLVTIRSGTLMQIVESMNILGASTYVLSWQGTAKGRIGTGAYGTTGVSATIAGTADVAVEFNTGTLALVQLEKGTVATAFDNRGFDIELARCRRYYFDGFCYSFGQRDASMPNGQLAVPFMFPMQMKAAPALTTIAGSGAIDGEGQAQVFPQAGFSFTRITEYGAILVGYAPTNIGTTANVPWRAMVRIIASARM